MKCRHCGSKVPAREEFCPSCGKYAKSTYFGISETRYKTIYAIYIFGSSFLFLGFLYANHIRLLTGSMGFRGLRRLFFHNLGQFIIISIVVFITCLILIILNRLHYSLWKFIYGIISAIVSPPLPEKHKTSSNNSPRLPTESDDRATGYGIPPAAISYVH